VVSAPGRCGIVGNPTDMYGGSVISCSVPMRAWVRVEPSARLILEADDGTVEINSVADLAPAGTHTDILRAAIRHLGLQSLRAYVACWSELPFGAGMSGSTAMMVATVRALTTFMGEAHGAYDLAELARDAELRSLGVTCGFQDHYMATFGGLNAMDFRDKEFDRPTDETVYATVEPLGGALGNLSRLPFVLANTGVAHHSGAVHRPIRERWLEGDPEVRSAYLRIGEIAREGKRALLRGAWERLGALMNENHDIQRRLGGSGPSNEALIRAALEAGAYGAKLAGAGHGGTIIALHPDPDQLGDALMAAGARRLFTPVPVEGVRFERADT
jgi:galactokinase/mevalonate kinase-like predicted kinase